MSTNLIKLLYHNKFFSRVFHTVLNEIQHELADCHSVLDLGCGPSSPLEYCANVRYSVGVEPFSEYIQISKRKQIHSRYINRKIQELDFKEKSFDAVIMIEVLEHLDKNTGDKLLKKIEKWAKKKVIVTTPNGFVAQKSLDSNPLQQHLSGWTAQEMRNRGYSVKGLAGLITLRQELPTDTIGDDLTASIKYQPRLFWFIVATLSQTIIYHFPQLAFEMFCVKKTIINKQDV